MNPPVPGKPDIVIRPARSEDHDAIRRIHQVTFDEHVAREPAFDSDAPFVDGLLDNRDRDVFNIARLETLVAELDGVVSGYVIYKATKIWGLAGSCFVHDISIAPDRRRQGVGRLLLQAMAGREPKAGALFATIWPENTPSQTLFEQQGYKLAPIKGTAMVSALKQQKVALRHKPLVLLTPLGVWLYVHTIWLAEMSLLLLTRRPPASSQG